MSKLLLFLTLACASAIAASKAHIDVIALEYPPFTTSKEKEFGTAFIMLSHYAKQHFSKPYKPLFLPPARAQQTIVSDEWCMSFYPPADRSAYRFIQLSDQLVKLGLFRLTEPDTFRWESLTEFSGQSVAVFRAINASGFQNQLKEAGMELVFIETLHQGFQLLAANRVDYVFGDDAAIQSSTLYKEFVDKFQFAESFLMEVPIGIFVNPKCESLIVEDNEH